ncbi:MAG: hypothetical protein GKS05_06595 [Nitrospirales bacterium]|nr:hypothetical protein [Nitrospirales bacterium]
MISTGFLILNDRVRLRDREEFMTPNVPSLLKHAFRESLEQFYAALQLAPPYHSIEKAIASLSTVLQSKTGEELQTLYDTSSLRQAIFQEVFIESGLTKKHRGIILASIRSANPVRFHEEQRPFLDAFRI